MEDIAEMHSRTRRDLRRVQSGCAVAGGGVALREAAVCRLAAAMHLLTPIMASAFAWYVLVVYQACKAEKNVEWKWFGIFVLPNRN